MRIRNSIRKIARVVLPEAVRQSWLYQSARHTLVPHDLAYDQEYYATDVEKAAADGAHVMANSIYDLFVPKSVTDVGCGTGALLAAFRARGCEVMGLENAKAGIAYCEARNLTVRKFNIERDAFTELKKFDIATSFEVAEHLPARCARRYVDLLCHLAPDVVMSAAGPGQGGMDHVNEQPRKYWIEKFTERNYVFEATLSKSLSELWDQAGVADFYYKNLMVFRRSN